MMTGMNVEKGVRRIAALFIWVGGVRILYALVRRKDRTSRIQFGAAESMMAVKVVRRIPAFLSFVGAAILIVVGILVLAFR
jgi:hypothetical protein